MALPLPPPCDIATPRIPGDKVWDFGLPSALIRAWRNIPHDVCATCGGVGFGTFSPIDDKVRCEPCHRYARTLHENQYSLLHGGWLERMQHHNAPGTYLVSYVPKVLEEEVA